MGEQPRLLVTRLAKEAGVDPATVTRWALVGVKGPAVNGVRPTIKLESYRIGGHLYTSGAAFERFVAAAEWSCMYPGSLAIRWQDSSRRAASESAAKKAAALGY